MTIAEDTERERTAATLLAALIQFAATARPAPPVEKLIAQSVRLTDALRLALAADPTALGPKLVARLAAKIAAAAQDEGKT